MRLHLENNSCERRLLVSPQFCDPHDLEILRSQVTPDFSFIDLGANVGLYSLTAARRAGLGAKILAVEPHPVSAKRLLTNIALNGFNIDVAQTAIADYDGVLELAVDSNNIGASTVRTGRRVRGHRETIIVPVCTLHRLVERHGFQRIDAMKIDIEGAEERALLSFLATAPRNLWPYLILLEPHPIADKYRLLGTLEAHGWRLVKNRKTDHCVVQLKD
jgi:FkbM family methyltransferase